MKAIAVNAETGTLELREKTKPSPSSGEALVRTHHVGIDRTDYEVVDGARGEFPEGGDHIVIGHEAVGEVVATNDTPQLSEGDIVTPTVRRHPDSETGPDHFSQEYLDMEPIDSIHERGICSEHGFMAEYFTSHAEHLVKLPDDVAEYGFLVEPISVIEKAREVVFASRLHFDWTANTALIFGDDHLGTLATARFCLDPFFDDVYCYGKNEEARDRIEQLGATYVTPNDVPYENYSEEFPAPDLIVESTGNPKHSLNSLNVLAPNGVCASLGVPDCDDSQEFAIDTLQTELTRNNKAIVGSINARTHHFEDAVDTLKRLPDWLCDAHTDGLYDAAEYESAFSNDDDHLKTGVTFTE